ncbi:MFS transporter [Atopobiaceae bacterium 24-176]
MEKRSDKRWAVLGTVAIMSFMSTLNASTVNVAMPSIQRDLGVAMDSVQLVSTAYLFVMCAVMPVVGGLADRLGKVRFFEVGVLVFTVGSLLCGLPQSLVPLIGARAVQAVGAGFALATNMGIVTEAFPANERGRALGVVATAVSLGLMCGPTVGGLVVTSFGWHWVFPMCVPFGVLCLVLCKATLPDDTPAPTAAPFDTLGAVLVAAAVLAVTSGLTFVTTHPSPETILLLACGAGLLVAFVCLERRRTNPLICLNSFRNPAFDVNLATMFASFLAVGMSEYIVPFYLQDARGLDAAAAGLVIMVMPVVSGVLGPVAGALSDRVGCGRPTAVGLTVYAAGLAAVAFFGLDTPLWLVVALLGLASVGVGLFQAPNNSLVMGSVDKDQLGFASSIAALFRTLGMALGVTFGSAVLYGGMGAAAGSPQTSFTAAHPEWFMAGFQLAFWVFAALVAVGAVLTWVTVARDPAGERPEKGGH